MAGESEPDGLSVVALVLARSGVIVTPLHPRFEELGWSLEGAPEVLCNVCAGPLEVYRKPYETTQGSYRYWAIVCLGCTDVRALGDLDAPLKKELRSWSERNSVSPAEPATEQLLSASTVPPSSHGNAPPVTRPPAVQGPSALVSETVREAAQAELKAATGSASNREVGVAQPAPLEGTRIFRVLGPTLDLADQPPGETFLGQSAQDSAAVQCRVVRASPTEAVVEASEEIGSVNGLRLFIRIDPAMVPKAFVDYLAGLKEAGFAGMLTGSVPLKAAPAMEIEGLNSDQQLAVGHIVGSSASVIWGPPGTGKTRVIGAAVGRLLQEGHSVCLVSNTNVAVDQALLHVIDAVGDFEPGEILRVGNPTIPAVSEHPLLTVRKAVEVKFADDLQQLRRLQKEVAAARIALDEAAKAEVSVLLERIDATNLRALVQRKADLDRRGSLGVQVKGLEEAEARAREDHDRAGRAFDEAHGAMEALRGQMHLIDDEREAVSRRSEVERLSGLIAGVEKQIGDLGGRLTRSRRRRELESELGRHNEQLREANRVLGMSERRLAEASAKGITPTAIWLAEASEQRADKNWRQAKEQHQSAQAELKRRRSELDRLVALSPLTEDEEAALRLIARVGSVEKLVQSGVEASARVEELRTKLRNASSQLQVVQNRVQSAEVSLLAEAKLVGTTLAQLVLHRGLRERVFDHVIVDEMSAAQGYTVYAALSKAKRGAALVGDFEQNWPISNCHESDVKPDLRPWLLESPFSLVGLSTAAAALATNGCVVLRRQYRFGRQVMNLANDVAYDGVLSWGRGTEISEPTPEITFVDTSGLKGDGLIQRGPMGTGRWWAIGAAISTELARQHGFEGVGVVTPYRHQAQLTTAQVRDAHAADVQVGTAHAFQGREFPVVIFDFVEDGSGTSWVGRANRDGSSWERSGSRIFTVGVTRSAGRLYLVGHAGAIRSAKSGPFAALSRLIDRSQATVLDAREILGPALPLPISPSGSIPLPATPSSEDSELLNDDEFYRAFLRDLSEAQERCVIFSPFISRRRLDALAPHFDDASSRGVRITCYTKSKDEISQPELLQKLSGLVAAARERRDMHEKVVLIDNNIAYLGSLNVLSNTGRTGELMLRLLGQETSSRLTQWMRQAVRN